VITNLIDAGHWRPGDPDILVVTDAGYDAPRLALLLADLAVMLGRIVVDRRRVGDPGAVTAATGQHGGRMTRFSSIDCILELTS
jgi:hypothetical protein